MGEVVDRAYHPDTVSPPGDTLQEILDDRGISQTHLSKRVGLSRKTINQIIKGKAPLTPETALALERVLGVRASFWSNRENRYREYLALVEESRRLTAYSAWAEQFPVAAMLRLGWMSADRNSVNRVRALLSFFGVVSPEQYREVWVSAAGAFRRSSVYESDPHAIAAWLRMGEIEAESVDTAEYDKQLFSEKLAVIRTLTTQPAKVFRPELERLCAEAGVVLVFVPALPKTRVSGATRWISSTRALIQLSLRYKTDDHLWFSFFHEAGHVLKHSKKTIFLEAGKVSNASDEEETEASTFAANTLIPAGEYMEFVDRGVFSRASVKGFASEQRVAPGIVVGRLQHDGHVPFNSSMNKLKRRFEWAN